jgi:methanogenic corrinoid protein MtbC1
MRKSSDSRTRLRSSELPKRRTASDSQNSVFARIALCIERGKTNKASSHPRDMKGQVGASELVEEALRSGIQPNDVLSKALLLGMQNVGTKFRQNLIFVPDVLFAAKAMGAAMVHLKPYFESGVIKRQGTFVIGTVSGDLHDIGKNLVSMLVEGTGWEVVDLGVDVPAHRFVLAIEEHPGCVIGISALLTSTMANMERTVKIVKTASPHTKILVGGAPITQAFATSIGADYYSANAHGAVEYLSTAFRVERDR